MRILTLFLAMTFSLSVQADNRSKAGVKANHAAQVLHQFMEHKDQAIPTSLLKNAECVTVITKMIRGGLIFGARTGWGVTSCRAGGGWSPAAYHRMSGLSWGFLGGLEKLNVVLVFTKRDAIHALSSSKLNLGADISVTAGPVGRGLEAGTDYKLDSPVYSYSRGKGLYAGASVNGSVISPREKLNHAVYGYSATTRDILTNNVIARVRTAQPFVNALMKYAP